jgi:hypothetical protein
MLMRFGVAKWLLGSVVGCGLAGGVGAGQAVAETFEAGSEERAS